MAEKSLDEMLMQAEMIYKPRKEPKSESEPKPKPEPESPLRNDPSNVLKKPRLDKTFSISDIVREGTINKKHPSVEPFPIYIEERWEVPKSKQALVTSSQTEPLKRSHFGYRIAAWASILAILTGISVGVIHYFSKPNDREQNAITEIKQSTKNNEGKNTTYESIKHSTAIPDIDHRSVGDKLRKQGDLEGAIKEYRLGIDKNPNDISLHQRLMYVLKGVNDINGAITECKKIIELDPKDKNYFMYFLTRSLESIGDLDGAIDYQKRMISLYRDATDYTNIASLYVKKGNFEEAIGYLEKAIKMWPNYWECYESMGDTLEKKGDLNGAITNYEKSLECNWYQSRLHLKLAEAYEKNGDIDHAIKSYEICIEMTPNSFPAQKALAQNAADRLRLK
jgi:Flp pilus assembly protein TadD